MFMLNGCLCGAIIIPRHLCMKMSVSSSRPQLIVPASPFSPSSSSSSRRKFRGTGDRGEDNSWRPAVSTGVRTTQGKRQCRRWGAEDGRRNRGSKNSATEKGAGLHDNVWPPRDVDEGATPCRVAIFVRDRKGKGGTTYQ